MYYPIRNSPSEKEQRNEQQTPQTSAQGVDKQGKPWREAHIAQEALEVLSGN